MSNPDYPNKYCISGKLAIEALKNASKYKHFKFIISSILADVSNEIITAEQGIKTIENILIEEEKDEQLRIF